MPELMPVLETALQQAGMVLSRHYGKLDHVDEKSEIDLVTAADRESEATIVEVIRDAFPSHAILAEESGATEGSEYRWLIDPLDGTTNFAHGMPLFAVSIAVLHGEFPVAAGVYNPFYQEAFLAEADAGATLNGEPIRVSAVETLAKSLMVTGFPYDRRERIDYYMGGMGLFLNRAQGVLRLGSAALDLCSVACGRLEGFWEEQLSPWDTAAGWLIVTEAGGTVTDFHGHPFTPFKKQVLATNGKVHPECLEVISQLDF